MSDNIPYLSDDELQMLMADVEAEAPVKAPDDLEEKVIARIVSRERKKTVDFTTYCLRVGFGVAAAIALLCIVPFIPERQVSEPVLNILNTEREIPTRDEVLAGKTVKSREEVLGELDQPGLYEQLKSYFD